MSVSDSPLSVLLEDPGHAALLTDIDGTLSRIVSRPDLARVPARASESLETLSNKLALVACVTGRPALTVKEMVNADGVTYFGNHGLELLEPGWDEPKQMLDGDQLTMAKEFIRLNDKPAWVEAQIRLEDKGAIQALHWRGAGPRTESKVHRIGDNARGFGLVTHWGRKVLELRPPEMAGKAGAVEGLLKDTEINTVVYAGDDLTDLEAVLKLRDMAEDGDLKNLIIVAVDSDEIPAMLIEVADIVVGGPDYWVDMVTGLAQQAG